MENVFPSSLARDDNRMIDILNLPRLRVLEMEDEPDQYTIHAESDATPFKCDKCNRMKFYAHGVRRQVYMDTPSHGKMVAIVVDRKRFRCTECGAVTLQPLSDIFYSGDCQFLFHEAYGHYKSSEHDARLSLNLCDLCC